MAVGCGVGDGVLVARGVGDGVSVARGVGDGVSDGDDAFPLDPNRPGQSDDPNFERGDANTDGLVNIADPVLVLSFLFSGGGDLRCADSADADDSGQVNVTDGIFLLNFLFAGEADPPAPFGSCGVDRTPDRLICRSYPPCEE